MSAFRFRRLPLLLATLALAGHTAVNAAQGGDTQAPMGEQMFARRDMHGGHDDRRAADPAAMQKRMAEHQQKLKQTLQITPAQESAWNAFVAGMTPPKMSERPSRADWEKLTTPQRLEKMQALKAERDQHMAQRVEATKRFYAALTPEQQKRFDAESHRLMAGPGERGRHGHPGGHHDGPQFRGGPGTNTPPAKG